MAVFDLAVTLFWWLSSSFCMTLVFSFACLLVVYFSQCSWKQHFYHREWGKKWGSCLKFRPWCRHRVSNPAPGKGADIKSSAQWFNTVAICNPDTEKLTPGTYGPIELVFRCTGENLGNWDDGEKKTFLSHKPEEITDGWIVLIREFTNSNGDCLLGYAVLTMLSLMTACNAPAE